MCTYIISSIVTSCPRGEVKGSACKLGTQRRDNPYCEAVVASRQGYVSTPWGWIKSSVQGVG